MDEPRPTIAKPADPLELDVTRAKILRAASEVYGAADGRQPSVDDIARAAGVARRTFYRYFPSADSVVKALYTLACAKVLERIQIAVAKEDDAWGKLRASVLSFLDFHSEAGQLLRVLQAEALRPGSLLEAQREAQFGAIAAILDAQIRESQGRRVDPLVLRGLLIAVEGLSNTFLASAKDGQIDRKRAERVMLRIMGATLAFDGGPAPPMPLAE